MPVAGNHGRFIVTALHLRGSCGMGNRIYRTSLLPSIDHPATFARNIPAIQILDGTGKALRRLGFPLVRGAFQRGNHFMSYGGPFVQVDNDNDQRNHRQMQEAFADGFEAFLHLVGSFRLFHRRMAWYRVPPATHGAASHLRLPHPKIITSTSDPGSSTGEAPQNGQGSGGVGGVFTSPTPQCVR